MIEKMVRLLFHLIEHFRLSETEQQYVHFVFLDKDLVWPFSLLNISYKMGLYLINNSGWLKVTEYHKVV